MGLVKGRWRSSTSAGSGASTGHASRREVSGGSAANTAVGVAALGGRPGTSARWPTTRFGEFFRHDMTAAG